MRENWSACVVLMVYAIADDRTKENILFRLSALTQVDSE